MRILEEAETQAPTLLGPGYRVSLQPEVAPEGKAHRTQAEKPVPYRGTPAGILLFFRPSWETGEKHLLLAPRRAGRKQLPAEPQETGRR